MLLATMFPVALGVTPVAPPSSAPIKIPDAPLSVTVLLTTSLSRAACHRWMPNASARRSTLLTIRTCGIETEMPCSVRHVPLRGPRPMSSTTLLEHLAADGVVAALLIAGHHDAAAAAGAVGPAAMHVVADDAAIRRLNHDETAGAAIDVEPLERSRTAPTPRHTTLGACAAQRVADTHRTGAALVPPRVNATAP